jgi:hypothetical protein
MKLPRKSKQWLREIEKVVDEVVLELNKHDQPGKRQLQATLDIVKSAIARNRGIEPTRIGEKTGEVVEALAEYLKSLPEEQRDWKGITTFLYIKYHQILSLINEQQMFKILISQIPFA